MRVLFVEDDWMIGDGVRAALTQLGVALDWFADGRQGMAALDAASYDAVILDLSLPGEDGLDVLAAWRAAGHTEPVLVLTARDAVSDRITGLNAGADDYLGKPFALDELIARLRALVRRSHREPAPILKHSDIHYDPASRAVSKKGRPVKLSPKELMLVELFLLNKKAVLSKTAIEEKLYTWGEEISSNAVEVHIHHIRRKLGPAFIRTVHGIGYTLGDTA